MGAAHRCAHERQVRENCSLARKAIAMLAPPAIPEWLPPAVTDEAYRILWDDLNADAKLVLRLATDKRMKPVWDELKKETHKLAARSVLEACASHTIAPREALLSGLTDRDASLTLFFWYAYAFAFMEPKAAKISSRDLPIADCRLQAARLRLSALVLWKLDLSPARDFLTAGLSEQFNIHHDNIERAAKFYDEIAGALIKVKTAEAPLVVSKDYGNRDTRGYVRMLATETRKLFGKTLTRSLARTASVALMKDVSPNQVRKWTERLPSPARTHD